MNQARSLRIAGHLRRVTLSADYWDALEDIRARERQSLDALCTVAQQAHPDRPLASALHVFVLAYFQQLAATSLSPPGRPSG